MPEPRLSDTPTGRRLANAVLTAALAEDRAAELLDVLFAGGSATLGPDGKLVTVDAELLGRLLEASTE